MTQVPATEAGTTTQLPSRGLTIADLVAVPHLNLNLLAGATGLGRTVSWAHVCELEDPAPWLEGGELVMTTGMGVPKDTRRQVAYVRRLNDGGLAGLAISKDMFAPSITAAMVAEADRLGFPILEVTLEVPFVAIARVVGAANQQSAERRLLKHVRIFDTLRTATKQNLSSEQLFQRLEELSGYDLYVASPLGGPLLPGVAGPPASLAGILPRPANQAPSIAGGYIVAIPISGKTAGFVVAVRRENDEAAGLTAVQHIATIAALQLANLRREREILRREGAETLAELLAGILDGETAARRLCLAGFEIGEDLMLTALPGDFETDLVESFHQDLGDLGIPHLTLQQRELYVLSPAASEVPALLHKFPTANAGVSRSFSLEAGFAVAKRESQWALHRAIDRGVQIVKFPDENEMVWLPRDTPSLKSLVSRTLGPIVRYDNQHNSDLLRSLYVWLERDQRSKEAAHILGIHGHTLTYRLNRIELLTGRRFDRLQDIIELWLGLRAYQLVGDEPGTPLHIPRTIHAQGTRAIR